MSQAFTNGILRLMRKCFSVFAMLLMASVSFRAQSQTMTILLRPSHADISAAGSKGAILVNLSDYSSDEVRYRLYNGANQYNCWDAHSGHYITGNSYASGPLAPGKPTGSATFWIAYIRGGNNSTDAKYRDRLGPAYSTNNITRDLPPAVAIGLSFSLTGTLAGAPPGEKFIILAFGGDTLISASHSDHLTGAFDIVCPSGKTITMLEVRDLCNGVAGGKAGNWTIGADAGTIHIAGQADVCLADLKADGMTIAGFSPGITDYLINLGPGTVTVPVVEATAADSSAIVTIMPATNLAGNKADRTTSIEITGRDGTTKMTYTIRFDPLLISGNIKDLKSVTEHDRLHRLSSLAIITAQKYEPGENTLYIQDNTSAIRVYDPSGWITTAYNTGDGITGLTGNLSLYKGMIQLVPASDPGPATVTGIITGPELLTVGQLKASAGDHEARLILLEDIVFGVSGYFNHETTSYPVSQNGEAIYLRTEFPGDFTGRPVPSIANVRGVLLVFNDTLYIAPRTYSDLLRATGVNAAVQGIVRVYPLPVADILTIDGIEAYTRAEISDITGRSIGLWMINGLPALRLDTSWLPPGMYILKLTSPAGSLTKKLIRH